MLYNTIPIKGIFSRLNDIKRAYCLENYAQEICFSLNHFRRTFSPELEDFIKSRSNSIFAYTVAAADSALRNSRFYFLVEKQKMLELIILTSIKKNGGERLSNLYLEYKEHVDKSENENDHMRIIFSDMQLMVGEWICKKAQFTFESTQQSSSLAQMFGENFGTRFWSFWNIPIKVLPPHRISGFNLGNLIKTNTPLISENNYPYSGIEFTDGFKIN